MCNACGYLCCASDEFGGCGCDHCAYPACWSEEEEFDIDPADDYPEGWPQQLRASASPRAKS